MKKPKTIRQDRILTELNQAPSLRVAELARRLDVSTETIRRDLDELTEQGLLNRTYGGAVRSLSTEPAVAERHTLFVAERERIARAAVQIIKGAQVLMIGSGATTVHTARRIAVDMKNITVLTHSFGVATVLAINPTIKVVMSPGNYHAAEGATVGAYAVSFLNGFYADFAILGASGLGPDGPSDALLECGAVYTAMVSRAARTLVVADHSKQDRLFPARYAPWRDIDEVVTDQQPGEALQESLRLGGVKLTVC
ncbi:DeoR/GlpR family transcriptional regulator of sugar metabolism [Rhizobium sp. SG_E_25_P2]|jgi:DeoR/GlpR family transcriptional regulator of sugar metabolism|uniref:DeoR/GlpR family DNA-binding transcription regulator n=1 Tax=Rhizobium sp. SG_E_25_P2 TaxID=2879942 RepID=UPI002476CA71|nr:DeoR/GlpR family DNA-binding transcription regulator [Rhizobium sp. SG_E_25_P2]MDH6266135.1 DeoR/GlpR family transcriptional regulator of sugar metabolism [Rhizobium sp. SG_E_25_P2]